MTRVCGLALACLMLGGLAGVASAEPEPQAPAPTEVGAAGASYLKPLAIIGVCFAAATSAIGGGFGIARIGGKCIEAMARQPEVGREMFAPMVVSAAMVEGGMLFAIVVCLLGIFFV